MQGDSMITTSEDRVRQHTSDRANARIERELECSIHHFARRLDDIEHRLGELDSEWDIERTLEANAAAISLAGLAASLFWRKAVILPMVVAGFLLQHAVQGWCPPLAIFRRLGVRTMREIDRERYALKSLRGDFQNASGQDDPQAAAESVMEATA